MKAPNRIIPILALSVTACIPTAIAIFCAAAFDSRSESSLGLLPLIGISFFAQIILQFFIGPVISFCICHQCSVMSVIRNSADSVLYACAALGDPAFGFGLPLWHPLEG